MLIALSQVKALIWLRPRSEIPNISTVYTQAWRRCAQVIHMFLHRRPGNSPLLGTSPEDVRVRVVRRRLVGPGIVTGCDGAYSTRSSYPGRPRERLVKGANGRRRSPGLCVSEYASALLQADIVSFEHLKEYLGERVRKRTNNAYST